MKVNEVLKVIFILCMERLCVFGFIGCIFIGDVTEQGYAKKKQKLTEELQSVTVATVADTSGFSEAKELEDFRTRMSTGLLKLYGRDRNAIKAAASTPSTAKKEDKWYKYDVYCLQKECTDIPRGNARTSLYQESEEVPSEDIFQLLLKLENLLSITTCDIPASTYCINCKCFDCAQKDEKQFNSI